MSNYSADLNTKTWARLSSQFSREKDFVFTYNGTQRNTCHMDLAAAECGCLANSERTGLDSRPNHGWHSTQLGSEPWMLIALKLPAFIEAERAYVPNG